MEVASTSAAVNSVPTGSWQSKLPAERAGSLREQFRSALFDDVVPWWTRHSPDYEYGGFFSCLERDGHAYAGDKFMWMLGREIWMFSHLARCHERREEWLNLASHGIDFLLKHAFRPDGKMYFRVTREGRSLSSCLSLYTEVFAAMALAEYGQIVNNRNHWCKAIDLYHRILPRLGQSSDTAMLGYPLDAEFHLHGHDMVRMNLAAVFRALDPHPSWNQALLTSVDSILTRHWKPDLKALIENVALDGSPLLDITEGRMVHPGHAIESAWMLMEIALSTPEPIPLPEHVCPRQVTEPACKAQLQGAHSPNRNGSGDSAKHPNDALVQVAIDIMLSSLERGWDETYGGIRYVTTLDGTPSHVLESDLKLWWPHCESLYTILLAWAYTGNEEIGRWYQKVHDYTFRSFPDPECGEWFGYLNRDGSPVFTAKATGWKCFFHLPRTLFRSYQLLSGTGALAVSPVISRPHVHP